MDLPQEPRHALLVDVAHGRETVLQIPCYQLLTRTLQEEGEGEGEWVRAISLAHRHGWLVFEEEGTCSYAMLRGGSVEGWGW